MAITRCPYCRAIIDKKDPYCNNCGTQLLFPEDESAEEEIPGDKIIEEDIEEKDYEIPESPAEESRKEEAAAEEEEEEEEKEKEESEEQAAASATEGDQDRPNDEKEASAEIKEEAKEEEKEEEVIVVDEEKTGDKLDEELFALLPQIKPGRTPKMKALTFSTEELEKIGKSSELGNVTVEKFLEVLKEKETRKAEDEKGIKGEEEERRGDETAKVLPQKQEAEQPEDSYRAPAERLIAPTDELPPWAKEIKKPGSLSQSGINDGDAAAQAEEREGGEEQQEGEDLETNEGYAGKEERGAEEREQEQALEEEVEEFDKEQHPRVIDEEMEEFEEEEEAPEEVKEEQPPREIRPSDSGIGLPERITQAKLPFDSAPVQEPGEKQKLERMAKREEAEEVHEEKEEASLPPLKLSSFIKAKLFDVLFAAVFWLVSIWLASRSMDVNFFRLLSAAAGTLILYFGALLVLYLFLFRFFLGETLGDRLFRERD